MTQDRLFSVTDFHDQPVSGVTTYQGAPHAYQRQFSEAIDEYTDFYWLMPIDEALFTLSAERSEILMRWSKAHRSGAVTLDSWPALPEDRARYYAIEQDIGDRLTVIPERSVTRRGVFLKKDDVDWLATGEDIS